MTADKKLESTVLGGMLTGAALTCGHVVANYGAPAMQHWRAISVGNASDALEAAIEKVHDGDLTELEGMLAAQALALQSIFADLAVKASGHNNLASKATILGLALKAQSQSRSTILAIADLKFPRTTAFVKQTNIANGNQQVNNGIPVVPAHAHESNSTAPNKVLAGVSDHGSTALDGRATLAAIPGDRELAPLGASNGTNNRKGQSRGRT